MTQFVLALVIGGVGAALGVIAGHRQSLSLLGIATLGLLVGLVIGMSNSPVLGTALAAGFALATQLLIGVVREKKDQEEKDEEENEADEPRTWQHPPEQRVAVLHALMPFCALCILGILCGVMVRANDLLSFRGRNLRDGFREQGFSEPQVERIMDRLAGKAQAPAPGGSFLLNDTHKLEWVSVWSQARAFELPTEGLEHVLAFAPSHKADLRRRAKDLKNEGKSPSEILAALQAVVEKSK